MSKKGKSGTDLGRCLIKDRFGPTNKRRRAKNSSLLHTAEVEDGYDWGRLNLQSVTEESSFQEFLSTAELAGTEFQAEKLNITFVNPLSGVGLLSPEEREKVKNTHDENKQLLGIPRRPKWNSKTTPEELQLAERDAFLEWRRRLAVLQEIEGVLLTPYEKNLEFWRQLWRVVEKSDVVVQIVDARNPLLFRCEDLEKYVKEVSGEKLNLILINKADFLSDEQRTSWAKYFGDLGVRVAFFSATLATEIETIEEEDEPEEHKDVESDNQSTDEDDEIPREAKRTDSEFKASTNPNPLNKPMSQSIGKALEKVNLKEEQEPIESNIQGPATFGNLVSNSVKLLGREELIDLFRNLHFGKKVTEGITTIGLVGYPNVGKSSTINALLTEKKVSVSATPGKTKHFQTIYLDRDLLLCDCPGLVMPSFVLTKADMVVNGILPIDQMRDHVPPVNLVSSLIPRHVIESCYGIMLPPPREEEDQNRPPTSQEVCNAYGYNRGFMTANGLPDNPRSSRYILKDFVQGKLLYCVAPPGVPQEEYHTFPERDPGSKRIFPPISSKMLKSHKLSGEDLDKMFFDKPRAEIHKKGVESTGSGYNPITGSVINLAEQSLKPAKPWKDHSAKRNKKEKLRRIYGHLDA